MNRIGFLFGAAFGFLIAAGRLNEYDVIHEGLLLRSPYMFLVMGSAVAVAMPLLWLLQRRRWTTPLGGVLSLTPARPERKHVLGAMVFGTGWAVAGTCPGPALALTAGGGLLGIAVIVGIVAGLLLRDAVTERTQPAADGPSALPTPAKVRV